MRKFLIPVVVLAAPVPSAEAVGFMTQLSCASDYYAYCSKHAVGSPGVRKCMNDNGPRLSNSCINALIADGEISKEEVARRREQHLAAKKPAAKPDQQQVTSAAQAAKADAAKAKLAARLPAAKAPPPKLTQEPVRMAAVLPLTLDQKTFEALKNRGNYFVVNAGDAVPTSLETAKTAVAAREVEAPIESDAATDAASTTPPIAATVPSTAAAEALEPEQQPVRRKSVRPADYPPGKMALEKKPSVEPQVPPPVVEAVVPPKPSSAETWLNYMKNRFEGGMNYQGSDANF